MKPSINDVKIYEWIGEQGICRLSCNDSGNLDMNKTWATGEGVGGIKEENEDVG